MSDLLVSVASCKTGLEAFDLLLAQPILVKNTNSTKRRAKLGGEYGANGEWYAGGMFINTVPENAKGKAKAKKKTGKQEIEPYVWAVAPKENLVSLYKVSGLGMSTTLQKYQGYIDIGGAYLNPDFDYRGMNPSITAEQNAEFINHDIELTKRCLAGDRWLDTETGETL